MPPVVSSDRGTIHLRIIIDIIHEGQHQYFFTILAGLHRKLSKLYWKALFLLPQLTAGSCWFFQLPSKLSVDFGWGSFFSGNITAGLAHDALPRCTRNRER